MKKVSSATLITDWVMEREDNRDVSVKLKHLMILGIQIGCDPSSQAVQWFTTWRSSNSSQCKLVDPCSNASDQSFRFKIFLDSLSLSLSVCVCVCM